MVLSLMGAFSAALATGAAISVNLVLSAVGVAFTAVGGWQWFKRLFAPKDKGEPVSG